MNRRAFFAMLCAPLVAPLAKMLPRRKRALVPVPTATASTPWVNAGPWDEFIAGLKRYDLHVEFLPTEHEILFGNPQAGPPTGAIYAQERSA